MSSAAKVANNTPDPNSKSALKKEAKRLEKEAKLAAKAVKAAVAAPSEKKEKEKKKKEEDAPFVNTTPKGEKKDMSQPMSAGYNPAQVESAWYDWWHAKGFFKPQYQQDGSPLAAGTFSMGFPPPNITGRLHIGHALTVAIQDSLVRWERMRGKTVLWVPGFDHASISTQSVVEKRLFKSSGQTRHDLGRERFLETVLDWKNEYQKNITEQLHRLGGSFEWDRAAFTMSEPLSKAVVETFCRLHEDGVLYRANRLVNWCVRMNTTLSNLEIEPLSLPGRTLLAVPGYPAQEKFEFGVLTHFKYPIVGGGHITVATTRPETMLGDTAIAVHPDDQRYKHLHAAFVNHPFISDRKIPIVCDSIAVDPTFGTGAVKITPAHDPNDYQVGVRHKLEFISILNDDGTLNENVGEKFKGMKRYHARNAVIAALKEADLYVDSTENPMEIKICSKSGDIIEPVLKPQWWVDCKPLAEKAIKASENLKIQPPQSSADWYRWLNPETIQDWCISRQLWWGHRCPAYLLKIEGESQKSKEGDEGQWVVARTLEAAKARAEELANGRKYTLEQDPDVLDTWFSSGLWPFSIMGWPDATPDMRNFYPTSMLETGWDILFFWVARMVLLGLYLTPHLPFAEVLCHAMIRDAHGRKMSKSLGNVIDPIDVIQGLSLEALNAKLTTDSNLDPKEIKKAVEGQKKDFPNGIPECGTDALRFALCAYSGGGRDINLEILRVEGYRKFCNKVFNATKFAMLKLDGDFVPEPEVKAPANPSLLTRWILHKLNLATTELNIQLAARDFMRATNTVYNFWLYELCDVYIEAIKPLTTPTSDPAEKLEAQQTLYTCLDHGLKLLHPFMPFVTEELWQRLPRRAGDTGAARESIMMSRWPDEDPTFNFPEADTQFGLIFDSIKTARSLAASYNLQGNIQLYFQSASPDAHALLTASIPTIQTLIKGCKLVSVLSSDETSAIPEGCGSAVVSSSVVVYTLVKGLIDLDAELLKLSKKLTLVRLNLDKILKVESQPDYKETVPEAVRSANEEKRKTLEAEVATLEASQEMFTKLK